MQMLTLHFNIVSVMIGNAYVWKAVTDSALTAELGGSFQIFQRGITSSKKGKLICIGASKNMTELIGMVGAIASMRYDDRCWKC